MINSAKVDAARAAMRRSAMIMSRVVPGMLPVYLSTRLIPTEDPEVLLRVGVECGVAVMEFNVDVALRLEKSLLGSLIYMGCLKIGLHHCDQRKQEPIELLKLASDIVVAEYAKKVVDISVGRNLEILNQLFPSYMNYWPVLKKHDFHPEVDLTLEKLFKIFKEEYAEMKQQMPQESEDEKKEENPQTNPDDSTEGKKPSDSKQGEDGKGKPSDNQKADGNEQQGGQGGKGDSKEGSPESKGQEGQDGKGESDSKEGESGKDGKDGKGESGGNGESEGSKDGEGESDADGSPDGSGDESGDKSGESSNDDSSGKPDSQGGNGQPSGNNSQDPQQNDTPQDNGQQDSGMGGDGSSGEGADGGSQAGNKSGDGAGGDGEGTDGDETDGEGGSESESGAPDSSKQGSGSGAPSAPKDDFSSMSRFFSLTNAANDLAKWDQDELAQDATNAKIRESLDKGLFNKSRSNLPIMLRNAARVKVDTAAMFKHFMRNLQDDEPISTWSRRNRKYLKYGMIAPGYIYDEIPKILCCIDVSGSMYQGNVLANCLTVMENALDGVSIDLVYWDAVCSPIFSTLKTISEMAIYGGGLTNPDCVLQKLGPERYKYDGLVFITDCVFKWPEPPKSKQIMILRSNGKEPFPDWCRYTEELDKILTEYTY